MTTYLQQVFDYGQNQVRTVIKENEVYFCLKDVCDVLDLGQVAGVKRRLEQDVITNHPLKTAGGKQLATFINEDGLYDVVLESRKPEARTFRKWITGEVLPSIRKNGSYSLRIPQTYIEALRLVADTEEEKERLALENAKQTEVIEEMKPKADYYDTILQSKSLVTATSIAKDYGMSARRFNAMLHDFGIQYKQSGTWYLYAKYGGKGYTQSVTHSIDEETSRLSMKWMQEGRVFLYKFLKEKGILPMIEREQEKEAM